MQTLRTALELHRVRDVGEVGGREHGHDTRGRAGCGRVDATDTSVREGTADERRVQHARELDIVDEVAATSEEPGVLDALDSCADESFHQAFPSTAPSAAASSSAARRTPSTIDW